MGGWSNGVGTLGLFHANSTAHFRRRHAAVDETMNWLGLGGRNTRPALTPLEKFKAFYDLAKVGASAKPNASRRLPCATDPVVLLFSPCLYAGGCGGGLSVRHAGQHSAGCEAVWYRPAGDRGGSGSTWGARLRCDASLHAAPMQLPCGTPRARIPHPHAVRILS